ncbi:cell wall metabolism sensor histidine kinase WalK [Aquibacillus sp. 3ASR75-11]|uniref:histidine kinase n=1 Tax=Terrihalobacillus insolitus TaxID=2950438 RepID=A0A9X3WPZ3_9BACI|nr:ATP-binding protein [Terrihalobacillus insolitus]MDC3423972.1 cell wall metabolism sensor histidine kinase WalK [Terrihalobacillus insolitus]
MRSTSRPFITYGLIVVFFVLGIGIVLSQITTDWVIMIVALISLAVLFFVLLFQIYEKYFKPIRSATNVAEELAKGNFKARTYESNFGEPGRLGNSLNTLARSLQEVTIQEKMQESQLKTVISNMDSGLILIDERGYVHLVNRKFLRIFGGESKDYVGYIYYDVLSQDQIHHAIQEAFMYEEKVKDSFTLRVDIEKRFLEIGGAPIFNESGQLKGVVLVFHDITELKMLEQMRKDFVANVSHELKTPITSIRGFTETLLDGAMEDEATRRQFLNIILDESERLQSLVHDLLELSRLEKDEMKLQLESVQIKELLQDVLPVIEHQAQKKNIQLFLDVMENVTIQVDVNRLKQVFINLLNNAISYTSNNGEVKLKVQESDEMVHIKVSDTGIGIPDDAKTRIFERFYRVDKARSRNTGGTGLGLAIVKHIVEAHGGTIRVESELNKGAIFIVELPKVS